MKKEEMEFFCASFHTVKNCISQNYTRILLNAIINCCIKIIMYLRQIPQDTQNQILILSPLKRELYPKHMKSCPFEGLQRFFELNKRLIEAPH